MDTYKEVFYAAGVPALISTGITLLYLLLKAYQFAVYALPHQAERRLADNFFQLEVIQSRSFKQSHAAREITYRAKLKNPSDDVPLNNLLTHLHALFETILQETKREYGDAGVMRIYISHPKLEKSIIIPPTYLGYLNSQKILDYIDTVLYSAGEISADDELIVNAAVVEFVTGSGRKAIIDIDNDLLCKRAIVKIRNTDYSCLPRAIVVGHKHLMTKLIRNH